MDGNNTVFISRFRTNFDTMTQTLTERRQHIRQSMNLPVTCCHLQQTVDPTGFCIGKISDAGIGGVQVRTTSDFDLTVGNRIVLLVTPKKGAQKGDQEFRSEIKGEVVWLNPQQQSFGLKFLLS